MKCKHRKIKAKSKASVPVKRLNVKLIERENKIILPALTELENRVNETVIGQENAVRSVCTKIYEGLVFSNLKNNILIVGKSGTGKTEIIRQIAEHLNVPCTIEDSTMYTEEGFVGASVTQMISNLIREANGNLSLASKGIIFVDEIDKKAQNESNKYSDVNKGGVLKSLLKLIEGTVVNIPNPYFNYEMDMEDMMIEFDTSNVIFIFGGAFEGLDEVKEKRLKSKTKIGFTSAEANHIVITDYMNTSFTKEDLIEYGLPAEFVGRISSIYETRELQKSDFIKILDYSKKSQFRKYEKILSNLGIEVIFSDNMFELIADNAKKCSTGARELNSYVSHIFERIIYDIFSGKAKDYTRCIIDDNIVFDNTKYYWEWFRKKDGETILVSPFSFFITKRLKIVIKYYIISM